MRTMIQAVCCGISLFLFAGCVPVRKKINSTSSHAELPLVVSTASDKQNNNRAKKKPVQLQDGSIRICENGLRMVYMSPRALFFKIQIDVAAGKQFAIIPFEWSIKADNYQEIHPKRIYWSDISGHKIIEPATHSSSNESIRLTEGTYWFDVCFSLGINETSTPMWLHGVVHDNDRELHASWEYKVK